MAHIKLTVRTYSLLTSNKNSLFIEKARKTNLLKLLK